MTDNKKISIGQCYNLFRKYGDLGLKVKTPYGFKKIIDCQVTERDSEVYEIETKNGFRLECSKNHRVKLNNNDFIEIKDLNTEDVIQTELGDDIVISIKNTGIIEDLLDIQVDEVEQYYSNGILSHNSTISIFLFMFLFFNRTPQTKTIKDHFNVYRDVDEVKVKGYLTIDGQEYIIERVLTRKMGKSGDYAYKNDLEFYNFDHEGNIIRLEGEQRRVTQTFITSAIGTEDDFQTTILTTGRNLDDLIEAGSTERGQVLTKFMGLESLRNKEQIAKKIQDEWSKKLISNTNNVVQLEIDNKKYNDDINFSIEEEKRLKELLIKLEGEHKTLEDRKDKVLISKNNDIDDTVAKLNPESLSKDIASLREKQKVSTSQMNLVIVIEPSKYYLEDDHEKIKDKVNDCLVEGKVNEAAKTIKMDLLKQLKEGSVCPTCKRALADVDHSNEIEKIENEILFYVEETDRIGLKLKGLSEEEKVFADLKKEYDDYERNKLRKTKLELEIDQRQLEIDQIQSKLDKYESNRKKLEDNQKIEAEIISLRTKIETIIADIRVTNNSIEKHKNSIVELNGKISVNNDLIKKIKSEEELLSVFKIYMSMYGKNGISKVIMKNMIPLLNQELHRILSDSCSFTLEININDKNDLEFLTIDNESRVVKSVNSSSGYERTIASLAIRSVLTKISSLPKPNIVVMDEVFGKIADENLELVGEFFKKIKNYFEHIILISHNPLIRNWSDNIIMVKKEENISSIDFITTKIS